ncbi:MAG: hypothetical protein L3J71_15450 [Victivallaceae bacterium]|nr:hypothetical protein [Victivallaceae bacterium]
MDASSFFEAVMLFCFGASWPISIIKTIKAKNPTGKSINFLYLVLVGYLAGCLKCVANGGLDKIIWLYALNGTMVAIDIVLVHYYVKQLKDKQSINPTSL